MAAAYTALEVDVARLRTSGYADHLELIRLSALVDGLVAQVHRLTAELAEMRRELHAARTAPATPDPYVELLATQVSELRATVATQQAMLADLTRRMLDLLAHLENVTVVAPVAPAAAPPTAPVPPAPPAYPTAGSAPAVPAPPTAPAPAAHVDLTPRPEATPRAPGHVPAADDALDDETVLRLRLIRESFGR